MDRCPQKPKIINPAISKSKEKHMNEQPALLKGMIG